MNTAIHFDTVEKRFRIPNERAVRARDHLRALFRRHTFSDVHAVDRVSFTITRGESVGIIGPNGAGKSTLLKLIAHVIYPDTGRVRVDGRVVPFLELGVGLQGELTGRENIYLYGAPLGLTRADIRAKFDSIVAFAELAGHMDQKVKNYSTGMQMRLAFAINAHVDADIFIVDEALAVGDEHFQQKCLAHMDRLKREGKTVVFVSHDLDAIVEHCTRVLLVADGSIMKDGSAAEVVAYYKARADSL